MIFCMYIEMCVCVDESDMKQHSIEVAIAGFYIFFTFIIHPLLFTKKLSGVAIETWLNIPLTHSNFRRSISFSWISIFVETLHEWARVRRREREGHKSLLLCFLYFKSLKGVTDPSCQMNFNKQFFLAWPSSIFFSSISFSIFFFDEEIQFFYSCNGKTSGKRE